MKTITGNSSVIVEPVDAKTVSVSLFFPKGAEDFDHNLTEVAREMKRERVSGYLYKRLYRYAGMLNSAEGI